MRPFLLSPGLASALAMLASISACADEPALDEGEAGETGTADGTGDESGETGDEPAENPFAELLDQGLGDHLGAADPVEVIDDGAATHYLFDPADGPMCLRGGDYWMSVRAGSHDARDLLIYQQGGGACWSDLCTAFESLGAPGVPDTGMLNRDLAQNPFAEWNAVYLPYCDGSLFAGDVDIDDDDDGAIDRFHHGLINLSAGLDVAHDNFPDAERIVLAGSSAGSYGALFSNMLVRTLWPEAELIIVTDCGVGIGKPGDFEFVPDLLAEWNAAHLVPQSCEDCVTDHITNLARWQLDRDLDMRFAAIASYDDAVIGGVFLGLADGEYRAALESELGALAAAYPDRYHRYFFDSTLHTTISTDSLAGGGIPGLTANFDDPLVAQTSVAQWLELLTSDDSSFGELIE
jgi:hypothetical protein